MKRYSSLLVMEGSVEIGLSHFQTIIEKYETLVSELTQELHSVKSEHDGLKSKVSTIVVENRELRKELNQIFSQKDSNVSLSQRDLVENLKQQLQSLLAEKEYMTKLWQNTMRSVDVLEGEISIFRAGNQNVVPRNDLIKAQQRYEEKIAALEHKVKLTEQKLEENMRKGTKQQGIEITLENQTGALKIVKNLEEEVLALQNRLQDSEKLRTRLQRTLKDKEELLANITRTNIQYRNKVSEAVQVVEAALNEKDAALFREKEATDEIQKVSQQLSDIMIETEEKIKKEVANAKFEFTRTYEVIQNELRKAQEEDKIKTLELEKYVAKSSLLESEIGRYQKGNFDINHGEMSKLLVLEKNLESTFQKLLVSEKQNIQLASEKQTMKNDMEQMAEHYERTLKSREIEKLTFQDRIKQLQFNLDDTNLTLNKLKEQLNAVNEECKLAEKRWMLQKEEHEKVLTKNLTDKIADLMDNYNEKIKQLQSQLDSKDRINKKWVVETKTIIENLEKLVTDLKSELHKLKKENKRLKQDLHDCQTKFEKYKAFLQIISKDVDKISLAALHNTVAPE